MDDTSIKTDVLKLLGMASSAMEESATYLEDADDTNLRLQVHHLDVLRNKLNTIINRISKK
jgi:hypothetical protein